MCKWLKGLLRGLTSAIFQQGSARVSVQTRELKDLLQGQRSCCQGLSFELKSIDCLYANRAISASVMPSALRLRSLVASHSEALSPRNIRL